MYDFYGVICCERVCAMNFYHLPFSNLSIVRAYNFYGYSLPENTELPYRKVEQFELEYFTKGGGGIVIDGNAIPFPAESVNLRKPGQIVCGLLPYDCCAIHLESTPELDRLLSPLPDKLFPQSPAHMQNLSDQIILDIQLSDASSQLKTAANLYLLLDELVLSAPEQTNIRYRYHPMIKKSIQFICANLDKPIDIVTLARDAQLSKSHFHKLFRECTGTTPNQFALTLKIERCKQLLCYTKQKISEIAASVGFYDHVYFSYVFKHMVGISPSEYRKMNRYFT